MLTPKLAFRNLFRNTRRTLLTCTLIGTGLAALIFTDGIINGMSKLLEESVTKTLQGEMQVHHAGFPDTMGRDFLLEDVSRLSQIIESDPTVLTHGIRTISTGMISSPYNMTGALIYGINPRQEAGLSKIAEAVIHGDFLNGESAEILLGSELVKQLEISLGDRVVITVAQVHTGEVSQSLFRLSGIVQFGLRELDSSVAFANLERSRAILGIQDQAHEIAIRFADPSSARNINHPLREKLSGDDRLVQNWLEFSPEISSVLEMSSYSTAGIGAILFLLVSLGVVNSMFMSIYERIYEFGVVRAIGTSSRQVISLVFWEAFMMALLSCGAGLILAGLIAWLSSVYGIPLGEAEFNGVALNNNIIPVYNTSQFVAFPLYVISLTLAAAIFPALYAGKIIPSEALHRSL